MCKIKTLIISSCCATKYYSLPPTLSPYDLSCFLSGSKTKKIASLKPYEKEAIDMYSGFQYGTKSNPGPLRKALQILNKKFLYDFKIVSAGYGYIDQHDKIVPYDICFDKVSKQTKGLYTVQSYSDVLNIHNNIQTSIENYDLIIFILANNYTNAIQLPFIIKDNQKLIFIDKSANKITKMKNTICIDSKNYVSKYSGRGKNYKLRANIFNHLIQSYIKDSKNPFEELYYGNLKDIEKELNKYIYNSYTYTI